VQINSRALQQIVFWYYN